jgi:hypothetical protein
MNRDPIKHALAILAYTAAAILIASVCAFGAGARPVPTDRERAVALLARCHNDPDLFNTAILGRPPYWWAQVEIGRSVVENRVTVVYTGNAVGKDYLVGGVVPWWLYTRHGSLVVVTGPSQTLLGTVTWKEIRKALEGARLPTGARTSVGAKSSPQTVTLPGVGWQALGYSTTNVERASGQHNRKLLVVVEEASGVEPEVWEALDSLKFVRMLAIGNPIRAEGTFIDLIRQAQRDKEDAVPPHKRVNAIHLPSTASPHADWDESPYGLADKTWLEAMERRYGLDSLWWRSHVEARIPEVSCEALIPPEWLGIAIKIVRPVSPLRREPHAGRRRIAIDLGEGVGRDSSVILVRDDLGILDLVGSAEMGLADAAAAAFRMATKWGVEHKDITFDRGGRGKDFPNHLYRHGIRDARPAHGNDPSPSPEFTNMRSWCAWQARRRLNPDWAPDLRYTTIRQPPFAIPAAPWYPRLQEDLTTLTYDLVGSKTRLLSKEDHLEKLGRSPDYGDTFLQSFRPAA